MSKEVLRIQFVNVKNCFLHFPQSSFDNFTGPSVCALKVENNGKVHYFSPYHSPCPTLTAKDFVGISPFYARLLDFKEDDIVTISSVNNLGSLKQIQVSPATEDDYEILLSASDALETSLLNQLRIVWPEQVFCAWISSNITVTLVVDSVYPNLSFGRLEEYSEVIVKDAVNSKKLMIPENDLGFTDNENDETNNKDEKILICRCVVPCDQRSSNNQPYVVTLSPENLPEWINDVISQYDNQPLWTIENLYKNDDNQVEPLMLQLKLDETINSASDISGYKSLFVSSILKYKLNLENGSKVILKPLEEYEDQCSSVAGILVTPYFQDSEENIKAEVHRSLFDRTAKDGKLLINTKGEFMLNDGRVVAITLRPLNLNWHIFEVTDLNDISISVNTFTNVSQEWPENIKIIPQPSSLIIRSFEEILYKAEMSIVVSLGLGNSKRNPLFFDNLLLTGSSGSGKTTLAKYLLSRISGSPYFLYTATIDGHQLRGKRIEVLSKHLRETLKDCYSHQPSVLLLDNLDLIAGAPKPDHENTEATLHLTRVSSKIIELIEEFQKDGLITVIATSESVEKVNELLFSLKGKTLFTSHLEIPAFSKNDRLELIKLILDNKIPHIPRNFEDVDINNIATHTDGFVLSDLIKLMDKAVFESWQRKVEKNEKLLLNKEDLEKALKNSKPSLLHGLNLTKQSSIFFSNIGGLTSAKEKLTEIILWPLMYPEIMNQCPLKAQNAVLLYGMPGTGKTLLANAVAGESKLNFIIVKGPELMSKYIGQSEEGVRKVFERAQAAKPCLLFFDEFESLAPMRGQEQTGVTDRVVNQLLTALDGVQPLTGVSVLAATSRPDLIDKALLRAGRIGSSVYCQLPNEEERLEILKVLSENIPVTDNVDFIEIAKKTEGFTGADLKGLLTTAQIKLIDSFVEKSLEEGINMENILPSSLEQDNKWSVKVDLEHIEMALKETNPSLSKMERQKFERIYKEFQNPRAPDVSTLKLTFA
ncbi:hypothetical protein O3M35_004898 [Rhynocoris fuscipes]|uniref:Peroxisomal ATPase PEX1 n=1 Tax=Rhynocoris fuscipes TaxID=488301 RepID=A0AAW1DIH9_9HEMI